MKKNEGDSLKAFLQQTISITGYLSDSTILC